VRLLLWLASARPSPSASTGRRSCLMAAPAACQVASRPPRCLLRYNQQETSLGWRRHGQATTPELLPDNVDSWPSYTLRRALRQAIIASCRWWDMLTCQLVRSSKPSFFTTPLSAVGRLITSAAAAAGSAAGSSVWTAAAGWGSSKSSLELGFACVCRFIGAEARFVTLGPAGRRTACELREMATAMASVLSTSSCRALVQLALGWDIAQLEPYGN
jgi:hypothetical protein